MNASRNVHQPSPHGSPLSRREFVRRAVLAAAGGLLVVALGAGVWLAAAGKPAPRSQTPKPNIILLTADALRADHVGAYGYARPTTPHLDRLAAESVLFEYAFAPASYTGPSLASLHTGKYPQEHFMQFSNGNARYRHTDLTIAELQKAHGYQTAAFVSSHVLERKRSQMDKGFTQYDNTLPDQRKRGDVIKARRTASHTTAALLQWLKIRARPPFFLWVHYIEPHAPYAPPPPYDTMFVNDALYRAQAPAGAKPGAVARRRNMQVARTDGTNATPRTKCKPVVDCTARYDGEIRYLDESIGLLLSVLKTMGLYDTSWLLFSSDHGESMGEHGYYFNHGRRLTLELVHVPLLIKPPGKSAPRRVGTQVSTIDLMPTLLEAVGIERPQGLSGQSILPLLRGERPKEARLIFSEMGSQYSLIDDRYQLLVGYDDPTFDIEPTKRLRLEGTELKSIPTSLFAYREDPLGQRDLTKAHHAAAEARFHQLRAFLQDYLQRVAQAPRVTRPAVRDSAEILEGLRQLGY